MQADNKSGLEGSPLRRLAPSHFGFQTIEGIKMEKLWTNLETKD